MKETAQKYVKNYGEKKMETMIEKLQTEKGSWEESAIIRKATRTGIQQEIKRIETNIKTVKKEYNNTLKKLATELKTTQKYERKITRDIAEAKNKVITLEKKIKTLPSQLRSRTKKNMGKAINKIVGGE